ncbi:PAS domain S-box protein [bacterium]|nr:PAS domain S-box protein [bacterium]
MKDKHKTKEQLIKELVELRRRINESEKLEAEHRQTEEALRESEEKLDSMLWSIGDHMSMMDKDLNIIWANRTAKKIFGNDIIGKKCYKVYHRRKEPCEPYPCITLKAFKDGNVHEHDTQVIGQDGETIDFHCTANVSLKDNEGKPTAVIEISRDITKLKQAEEALKQSQEKFKDFLDNLADVAYGADDKGNITYANRMAEVITGLQLEEIVGKPFLPLFSGESQKLAIDVYQRTLMGESPIFELTFNNGKICQFKNEPLKDKDGKILGIFGIARDITESKKAEKALKEKEKKLQLQTQHLEEVNTALKVLLEHQEEEKRKLEESILMNVRRLVMPYIEELDKNGLEGENKTYLNIITSNIENLVSPFANRLSSKYLNLTPTEIKIADLVKQGQTSKEIASMLNVSHNSVMFHRKNIRKKLGLANKKVNLRSYLCSFSK